METNNEQQVDEITLDEVLNTLNASGRSNWTKKRLTRFTSEKISLLPALKRISHPGSNHPVYVWKRGVLRQVIELYDIVERGQRDKLARLFYLWLRGYEVPFEPIQRLWLQPTDAALHYLTEEGSEPDDVLWQMSKFIAKHWLPTWEFSPRPEPAVRRLGVNDYLTLTEVMLGIFLTANYEPEITDVISAWVALQKLGNTEAPNQLADIDWSAIEPTEEFRSGLHAFQSVFSLPQLRGALLNATEEEWAHAREDYQTLCQWLQTVGELFPSRESLSSEPDIQDIWDQLFLLGGFHLVPLLLSARHYGYGHWIDQGITWVNEKLAEFNTPEGKEQLAQQLADFKLLQQEQKQAGGKC